MRRNVRWFLPQRPRLPPGRRPRRACGPRRWPASSPGSTASTWPRSAAAALAGGSSALTSRTPSASTAAPSRAHRAGTPAGDPRQLPGRRPAPTSPGNCPRSAALSAVDAEADEIPLSTVRRLTAQRLAASAREAPHFYLTVVADAGELLAFRAQVNERRAADVKVSVTDLLTKACAAALAAHPEVNASWDETRILRHRRINIGVAVAIDDGLIVPVIRDADRKTLTEIAHEAHDLTARARDGGSPRTNSAGGTFTVSNLGMYGIRQFTAVINPPQAAILAVGEAVRQPVVHGNQVTIGTTMTLTLSIDHRAVDGATAAGFLTGLRELIEEPLNIVL